MASGDPSLYTLTVRPHRTDEGRFEYVFSRSGYEPALSDVSYPSYEAAKEAGDKRGRDLGLTAAPSHADN